MSKHVTHWINGQEWSGTAARHGDIYNPATGQVTGTVDFATSAVMDQAVASSKAAFAEWRHLVWLRLGDRNLRQTQCR